MALFSWNETMIEYLKSQEPLDLQKAKRIAQDMGVSQFSVIAKAKHLKLKYLPVIKEPTKEKSPYTKFEVIELIEDKLGIKRSGSITFDLETLTLIYENLPSKPKSSRRKRSS